MLTKHKLQKTRQIPRVSMKSTQVKVLLGSGLPCVGNAVDQKICQRLPCPMTGLSGILGGTDGTVRLQKRTKRKRTVRK